MCGLKLEHPLRCEHCFSVAHMCVDCICTVHRVNPFHRVEVSVCSYLFIYSFSNAIRSGPGCFGLRKLSSRSATPSRSPSDTAASIVRHHRGVRIILQSFPQQVSNMFVLFTAAAALQVPVHSHTSNFSVQNCSPHRTNPLERSLPSNALDFFISLRYKEN